MKRRVREKIENRRRCWVEIVQDGLVDAITRDRKLINPRFVINKGAKVFVCGPPQFQDGINIVPVKVRVSEGVVRRCWVEVAALHKEQLRTFLEQIGIRSARRNNTK